MFRFWRGLISTLTGLAFPLGSWWCANYAHLNDECRRSKGLIIILPGIEGKSPLNINIARGLADSGFPIAIEILDWTTGFWPLFLFHLRAIARARRKARKIAARIQKYQEYYPDRPVVLIGQSGGGAMAMFVLEILALHRPIAAAFLLGPAISARYDPTKALQGTTLGTWNFYSPLDLLFLTLGTTLLGTMDGHHTVSAGAWGFHLSPNHSFDERRSHKNRLRQIRYDLRMLGSWHSGGHFGWANRVFVANWLAPILARTLDLPHGHGCQSPQLAKYC